MPDLKGKRVIITGASKGLGYVCARTLAQKGCRMVLLARSTDNLKKLKESCKNSRNHLALAQDLTDFANLAKSVNKATKFLGGVDIVLHVLGGGLGLREPLISADGLLKLFTLNVGVAAQINRIVLGEMMQRGSGNLVHVGSISSTEATGSVGYNTVKAALAAYVRSLGRETAASGVVVTGILPGGFWAPENSWERLRAKKPEVVEKFIKERIPRGFLGKAEELIPMILLLCSKEASMMSGCMVPVDAGEGKAYLVND